jgi:hypothetical protein
MAIITSRGTIDVPSMGRLPAQGGIDLMHGNVERKKVLGDYGVLGETEEFTQAPGCKAKLSDTKSLDIEKLKQVVGETITIQFNSGKKYSLTNASMMSALETSGSSGEIEVVFEGDDLLPL